MEDHAADVTPQATHTAPAPTQPAGPVATVNGIVIPASHATLVINEQARAKME